MTIIYDYLAFQICCDTSQAGPVVAESVKLTSMTQLKFINRLYPWTSSRENLINIEIKDSPKCPEDD